MKSIKEYILDVIQESYIFEMAYDRKEMNLHYTKDVVLSCFRICLENLTLLTGIDTSVPGAL